MGWQDVIMSSFCHDAGGTESRVARPGGHARHQSARLTTSGNTSYSLIGCFATMPAPRLAGLWAAAHLNVCFDTMPSFDWLFSCYVCSLIDWIMSGSSSDWLFCDTACSLIDCFVTLPVLWLAVLILCLHLIGCFSAMPALWLAGSWAADLLIGCFATMPSLWLAGLWAAALLIGCSATLPALWLAVLLLYLF